MFIEYNLYGTLKESCGNMLFHEVEVVGLNLLTPYVHWDFFPLSLARILKQI